MSGIGVSGTSIQIPIFMNAGPALDAIKGFMGGLGKLAGKISKVGAGIAAFGAIIGWLAFRQMKKALTETIKFQKEMIGLTKILGQEAAMPIGEALGDLTEKLPLARDELIEVAETAARLGIRGSRNILRFSETMAMMGIATNISASTAADAMARIAKQTGLPIAKLENLGSVINELSNTMATSTSEIVAAVRRSAPELARLGFQAEEIAALAATLNTVSESATRAGTRLRRLGQALSDPAKVGVFASALKMSETAFRDFVASDPQGAILKIVDAFEEGGQAAEIMSGGLDARVRLALAALSQVTDDLRIAFRTANTEMKENVSLRAEVDRILGLVVSKQVIYNNSIKELRRELGEEVLPLYQKWLELKLAIIAGANALVEEPLGGMVSKEKLEESEKAVKDYIRAVRTEFHKGNLEYEDLLGGAWWKFDFDDVFLPKAMNRVREENMRGMELYKRQYLDITNSMLEDASIGPEQMIIKWGRLSAVMGQLNVAVTGNARMQLSVGQLLDQASARYEAGGYTATRIMSDLEAGFKSLGLSVDMLTKMDLTDAIGLLTEGELERITTAEEALDKLFTTLDERVNGEKTLKEQILGDALYGSYISQIKELESKEESLDDVQRKRLASMRLYVESMDLLLGRYSTYLDNLKKVEAGETTRAIKTGEMVEKLEELDEIMEFVNTHSAEMVESTDLEQQYSAMLTWIDGLRHATDKTKQELKEFAAQWFEFKQSVAEDDELTKALDRMKNRLDFTTLQGRMRLLERIIDGMADSAIQFFDALITGSGKAGEAMVNMIKSIVYEMARSFLFKQLLSLIGPDGADWLGLNKMSKTSTAVAGGVPMARGGPIGRGRLALVGERGPELFVPNVGGRIIPNDKLTSGGGDPIVVNNHFTIQALDGSSVREVLTKEQNFIAGLSLDTISRHRALKR